MEILLPALVIIATKLVAWAFKKFGVELGRALVLVTAFVFSAGAAYVWQFIQGIPQWQEIVTLFGSQMVIYELIYKTIIEPAINPQSKTQILPKVIEE